MGWSPSFLRAELSVLNSNIVTAFNENTLSESLSSFCFETTNKPAKIKKVTCHGSNSTRYRSDVLCDLFDLFEGHIAHKFQFLGVMVHHKVDSYIYHHCPFFHPIPTHCKKKKKKNLEQQDLRVKLKKKGVPNSGLPAAEIRISASLAISLVLRERSWHIVTVQSSLLSASAVGNPNKKWRFNWLVPLLAKNYYLQQLKPTYYVWPTKDDSSFASDIFLETLYQFYTSHSCAGNKLRFLP